MLSTPTLVHELEVHQVGGQGDWSEPFHSLRSQIASWWLCKGRGVSFRDFSFSTSHTCCLGMPLAGVRCGSLASLLGHGRSLLVHSGMDPCGASYVRRLGHYGVYKTCTETCKEVFSLLPCEAFPLGYGSPHCGKARRHGKLELPPMTFFVLKVYFQIDC